ncbi:MAG: hypothetical protein WAT79_04705 [Saprospiraceae bacterium]
MTQMGIKWKNNTPHLVYLRTVILLFFGILIFSSCFKIPKPSTTTVDNLFMLPGQWTCISYADSGICWSGKDSLQYHLRSPGDGNGYSPAQEFYLAFQTTTYEKFFDFIFFDQKLRRLYRDSVVIRQILPYDENKKRLFPCGDCNGIADINFLNNHYMVPFKAASYLMNHLNMYDFIEKRDHQYYTSIFLPKTNGLQLGCEIRSTSQNLELIVLFKPNDIAKFELYMVHHLTPLFKNGK